MLTKELVYIKNHQDIPEKLFSFENIVLGAQLIRLLATISTLSTEISPNFLFYSQTQLLVNHQLNLRLNSQIFFYS